ncbi:MAG: argininosuccinate lyase [Nitrospiria bacterium]
MTETKRKTNKKLWGGRFQEATRSSVEKFTASIHFDRRLYRQDIQGSIAHSKILCRANLVTQNERDKIITGLEEILKEIETGKFKFSESAEDIHMSIEQRLIEKIGSAGEKLHTGRSRNDQVVLDLRLYLRGEAKEIAGLLDRLQEVFFHLAKDHLDVIMPGYTHLQKAQPILFSHYILAYYEMTERDQQRLADLLKRINVMPLGSGALAGPGFPLDREYAARLLDFPEISQNSLDAVSDRDFVIEFHSFASLLMMHLSRLSEELILWSSTEFGFIELPDEFCTGSSMMPQKKNPDIPELVRGKTGRVYGNLFSALTMMKSLPLAYNRDLQEDKEPLFETLDLVKSVLSIYAELLSKLEVNRPRMLQGLQKGYLLSTDIADYLVGKGMTFRKAHALVGNLVRYCMDHKKHLEALSLTEYRSFSKLFQKDILGLSLSSSINKRNVIGGTATSQVIKRLERLNKKR